MAKYQQIAYNIYISLCIISWWLQRDMYCIVANCIIAPLAITWANVDPDLCGHMVSLGHTELTLVNRALFY